LPQEGGAAPDTLSIGRAYLFHHLQRERKKGRKEVVSYSQIREEMGIRTGRPEPLNFGCASFLRREGRGNAFGGKKKQTQPYECVGPIHVIKASTPLKFRQRWKRRRKEGREVFPDLIISKLILIPLVTTLVCQTRKGLPAPLTGEKEEKKSLGLFFPGEKARDCQPASLGGKTSFCRGGEREKSHLGKKEKRLQSARKAVSDCRGGLLHHGFPRRRRTFGKEDAGTS